MKKSFGCLLIVLFALSLPAKAQEGDADLAKAAQNPVGDLISLPFQNNTSFGLGEFDRTLNVLNIQPVFPFQASENWNIITRTIVPIISQPHFASATESTSGLGDINFTAFISPKSPGKIIWGVGPAILLPTATDDLIGSGKWSIGPSIVALSISGPWVVGVLVNNVWSVAGADDRADVNQMLLHYFINYNMANGWYFTSAPIITANWEADPDYRWIVPFGGGVGKIVRLGKLPINMQVQTFYNVERPEGGADYSVRFQIQLMFPKNKP